MKKTQTLSSFKGGKQTFPSNMNLISSFDSLTNYPHYEDRPKNGNANLLKVLTKNSSHDLNTGKWY